jgi:hypothetical protein
MKALSTVNVIEQVHGEVMRLTAFPRTCVGEAEAEKLFLRICRENGLPDSEYEDAKKNGEWETGTWCAVIRYSSTY